LSPSSSHLLVIVVHKMLTCDQHCNDDTQFMRFLFNWLDCFHLILVGTRVGVWYILVTNFGGRACRLSGLSVCSLCAWQFYTKSEVRAL
jgi:hypothetical protein